MDWRYTAAAATGQPHLGAEPPPPPLIRTWPRSGTGS